MEIDALVKEVHRRREGRGLVLFLDYDGTLVKIVPGPEQAFPTPEGPSRTRLPVSAKS